MYKRVEAQMILRGVSRKELAKQLDISYNTLNQKLNGKSDFSLSEALKIKQVLNAPDPMETLFNKD